MRTIPLQDLPAQSLITILDGQNVGLSIYQRHDRLYLDLTLDESVIATGYVCLDAVPVIQQSTDFRGVLMFVDMLGNEPPQWDGIGGDDPRWILVYLTAAEAAENALV